MSRQVYLVLYLSIGVKEMTNVVRALLSDHRSAHRFASLRPHMDGQVLLYGLMVLVLIRVLAFLSWRRLHGGDQA
jgi:hypothetical protein